KRPIANVAWRHAKKPAEPYYQPYWTRLRALRYDFLDDRDTDVTTALRFTLSVPGVHTAIVGTTNAEHWHDNAARASAGLLPRSEFDRIRARWDEAATPSWVGQV